MSGDYIGTHDFTNATVLGINSENKYSKAFTSQTSVIVSHNLNDNHPIIQVYDDNNILIMADSIKIDNSNQATVTFGESTSGTIVVNTGFNSYKYTDTYTSVTSKVVNHSLNDSNPLVQVYDNNNVLFMPNSVTINSGNQLTVDFGGETSTGTIVILSGTSSSPQSSIFLGLLSSDPSSPDEGQIWYNSTSNQFKGYNGTSVVILG